VSTETWGKRNGGRENTPGKRQVLPERHIATRRNKMDSLRSKDVEQDGAIEKLLRRFRGPGRRNRLENKKKPVCNWPNYKNEGKKRLHDGRVGRKTQGGPQVGLSKEKCTRRAKKRSHNIVPGGRETAGSKTRGRKEEITPGC